MNGLDATEPRRGRHTILARGEPMLWATAAALMAALLMIVGLLVWILGEAVPAFWPRSLFEYRTVDGRVLLGEPMRSEGFGIDEAVRTSLPDVVRQRLRDLDARDERPRRTLVWTGRFDPSASEFAWVADVELAADPTQPPDAAVLERASRGRCHGRVVAYAVHHDVPAAAADPLAMARRTARQLPSRAGREPAGARILAAVAVERGDDTAPRFVLLDELAPDADLVGVSEVWEGEAAAWEAFERRHAAAIAGDEWRAEQRRATVGSVDDRIEAIRLEQRELELRFDPPIAFRTAWARFTDADVAVVRGGAPEAAAAAREAFDALRIQGWVTPPELTRALEELHVRRLEEHRELAEANQRMSMSEDSMPREVLIVEEPDGSRRVEIPVADVVRAYRPNRLGTLGKLWIYAGRWGEFVFGEPRQANAAGGVFPAIFGTVLMTLLMIVVVLPFGVFAALYLHEYARPGFVVSTIRVAVNNLAGVPSIVFGVFGLGFFCYIVGASIDELLFRSRLPEPTFGRGGILWAALTLALLTVPVVIVATEEALAAVPNSMRHGSFACGAGRWQTIRRIVLPRALPGIMTGAILAMARGAGEVAPLMLVGAVKYVPDLPLDAAPPFGLNRSFMHLGFHIFDQGFQSRDSEAARPSVYTTTVVLLGIVVALNLVAVRLRARFRRRFVTGDF